jgi:hypothetical protein
MVTAAETSGLAFLFEGIDHFYTTHLPSAIILTILLLGIGVGIGKKLIPLLQEIFGKSQTQFNVNLGEQSERTGRKLCIPESCPDHKAEKERSLRNETEIERIWAQFGLLRTELLTKLQNIENGNQEILLALVEAGKIAAKDVRRKRGG